jgi:hypothetical protein
MHPASALPKVDGLPAHGRSSASKAVSVCSKVTLARPLPPHGLAGEQASQRTSARSGSGAKTSPPLPCALWTIHQASARPKPERGLPNPAAASCNIRSAVVDSVPAEGASGPPLCWTLPSLPLARSAPLQVYLDKISQNSKKRKRKKRTTN